MNEGDAISCFRNLDSHCSLNIIVAPRFFARGSRQLFNLAFSRHIQFLLGKCMMKRTK